MDGVQLIWEIVLMMTFRLFGTANSHQDSFWFLNAPMVTFERYFFFYLLYIQFSFFIIECTTKARLLGNHNRIIIWPSPGIKRVKNEIRIEKWKTIDITGCLWLLLWDYLFLTNKLCCDSFKPKFTTESD